MKVDHGEHGGACGTQQALVRLVLHETRTPLNAICGFTDLLLAGAGGPLSAETLDYVEQVAHAGRALERGLGHLRELVAVEERAPGPGAAPVDLVAGLTAAGFAVAGAGPERGCCTVVRGDAGAWLRLSEVCRAYLQAGGRRPEQPGDPRRHERPDGPRAVFDQGPGGRLELTLSDPAALPAPGTGLLALELARRLASLVGGELLEPAPDRVVIAWPAEAGPAACRAARQKAAGAGTVEPRA